MMPFVGSHGLERGGGIDVPIDRRELRPDSFGSCNFEFAVENTDAARLRDKIGAVNRLFEGSPPSVLSGGINNHASPVGIGYIAVLLPSECVRLVESDLLAERRKRSEQPAIISRCPI